jgi:hypothetical protein
MFLDKSFQKRNLTKGFIEKLIFSEKPFHFLTFFRVCFKILFLNFFSEILFQKFSLLKIFC